ncbi:phosphoribosylglycinamide formyltransferase [Virgibacillus profundi]|uniref:Phosphoribosylglycinamide formyltransferase n=1 Tax=Virgibacillus profundi TaxID=2024555 RepID=A0A2A2IA53_9BACI|nr:phosphoribosylglycinamide formyltransferase [Virgibacillus profundi]PAV28015.1 phosphoribosylglycinamide formyltransferase [Virgibacillus profundi]PXY52193.1 phosphoribosylglycinamide formyltransferase [Virgibacillus profundi]
MSKVKAAVFASGTGSNFAAIMESEELDCDIVLLVCDKQEASVLEKAEKYNVPAFVFNPKDFSSKADYENEIIAKLQEAGVTWIFLAGYMRIVGPTLLQTFDRKIVNIHPSLLPAFPGVDAIGQAYKAGAKTTGVTVHFIDAGIDTGPIIAQESLDIHSDDTEETLKQRIQKIEHELYPRVINQLLYR